MENKDDRQTATCTTTKKHQIQIASVDSQEWLQIGINILINDHEPFHNTELLLHLKN